LGYTPYSSANPAWYTSCTGTLTSSSLKTVNGCCLVWSWDICIQSWWIENDTTCTTDTIEALWSWTKAQFNCITNKDPDRYYIITDEWWPVNDFEPDNAWTVWQVLTKKSVWYEWQDNTWFSPSNCGCCWQVLTKTSSWYCWDNAPATWIQNLSGSPICICYKWTWTKADFDCLWTYRCDTEYNVIG
jgi:hypothetical protein